MRSIAVVGAGFTGAVIAHQLAKAGYQVEVFESRNHVAGNCYTERDPQTKIMVHKYGPHIFHTNSPHVWNFVNQFGAFQPRRHQVMAVTSHGIFSLPINLHTINQFDHEKLSPSEARKVIKEKCEDIPNPSNFEDQALSTIGRALYKAFLEGYTKKQWGRHPTELPASILKRLPLRFSYDTNYYEHTLQGIPVDGYTPIVENMLNNSKQVILRLETEFQTWRTELHDHVFYSGPLDKWFQYQHGRLAYRTLDFKLSRGYGDLQGTAVINYCEEHIPFTRTTEFKHFAPWERHEQSIMYTEYSRECEPGDIPYYPVRLAKDQELLTKYERAAAREDKVTFVGRLGRYEYLDMDVAIAQALDVARKFVDAKA